MYMGCWLLSPSHAASWNRGGCQERGFATPVQIPETAGGGRTSEADAVRLPYRRTEAGENQIVKQLVADDDGNFDFGPLPVGHYTLLIASTRGEDTFDVQVTPLQKPTASVTIDVSPNYPDCTGGHEFISTPE